MTRCADRRAAVVADVKLPGAVSLFMGKVRELARGGSLVCHVVFEGDCRIGEVRAEMRNPYLRLSPTQLQHGYLVVSPPVTDAPETSENNTNTFLLQLQVLCISSSIDAVMSPDLRDLCWFAWLSCTVHAERVRMCARWLQGPGACTGEVLQCRGSPIGGEDGPSWSGEVGDWDPQGVH